MSATFQEILKDVSLKDFQQLMAFANFSETFKKVSAMSVSLLTDHNNPYKIKDPTLQFKKIAVAYPQKFLQKMLEWDKSTKSE